jgi:hypothetical protein
LPDASDFDAPSLRGVKTHQVFAALVDVGKKYGDLTGRFPHVSRRGNPYVLVVYDYDGNTISSEAIKSRNDKETIRAYSKLHQQPELQIVDNECSATLKRYLLSISKEEIF